MRKMPKKYKWIIISCIALLIITAIAEFSLGRPALGLDGKLGLWVGNVWSSEQSQRFTDPYSLAHISQGLLLYCLLWLVARKLPVRYRLVLAVLLQTVWEILENSPILIGRYQTNTISYAYVGDSVLNSFADTLMMMLGFLIAWRARLWVSVSAVIAIELALLFFIRDNLILNLIMLMHPIEAIKTWQAAGQPIP